MRGVRITLYSNILAYIITLFDDDLIFQITSFNQIFWAIEIFSILRGKIKFCIAYLITK